MHPYLEQAIAAERAADLMRAAQRSRVRRAARAAGRAAAARTGGRSAGAAWPGPVGMDPCAVTTARAVVTAHGHAGKGC